MEQHASKSIKQKNNNNNDDDGSQRKAQSLLHTLLDKVNKDKARIEELIKQKNLQGENAKADSLSEKRPSTRR
jgi:transcription termination factor NusB